MKSLPEDANWLKLREEKELKDGLIMLSEVIQHNPKLDQNLIPLIRNLLF